MQQVTVPVWPVNVAIDFPVSRFQTGSVLSHLPLSAFWSLSKTVQQRTQSVWPVNVAMNCPVSRFQTCSVLSPLPLRALWSLLKTVQTSYLKRVAQQCGNGLSRLEIPNFQRTIETATQCFLSLSKTVQHATQSVWPFKVHRCVGPVSRCVSR